MSIRIIFDEETDERTDNDPVCDVSCDAEGCTGSIRLMAEDFGFLNPVRHPADGYADGRIEAALRLRRWDIDSHGVQHGNTYCPLHAYQPEVHA